MKYIRDIYAQRRAEKRPVISFEFHPAKTPEAESTLVEKTIPTGLFHLLIKIYSSISLEKEEPVPICYSDLYNQKATQVFKKKRSSSIAPVASTK